VTVAQRLGLAFPTIGVGRFGQTCRLEADTHRTSRGAASAARRPRPAHDP